MRLEIEVTVSPASSPAAALGPFPGDEFYFQDGMLAPRPLGLVSHVAVGAETVFVGIPDEEGIRVFSLDGNPLKSLPVPYRPRPLTGAVREAFVDERAEAGRNPENTRRFYGRIEFPDHLPSFDGLILDPSGGLWIRAYPAPGESAARWSVLDGRGAVVATALMPAALTVFQIGTDHVLGVERDEFDVESVVLYRLVR